MRMRMRMRIKRRERREKEEEENRKKTGRKSSHGVGRGKQGVARAPVGIYAHKQSSSIKRYTPLLDIKKV